MTREQFFRQVLSDMGVNLAGRSVYEAAFEAGLTNQSQANFNGSQTITREEAALVLARGLGDDPSFGTGVDYAMSPDVGLYQGFEGGVRGTGQEAFYSSYYTGGVGQRFRTLLGQESGSGVRQLEGENVLEGLIDEQTEQEALNALEIIKDELALYGLEGLADQAYEMLLDGIGPQAVLLRLRQTPEFAARFPGLELRRANGLPQISPGAYIDLERQYRNMMMTAGIPEGFYDSVDDFAEFIGNDVSQNEMGERIALAAEAVRSIDPNLKAQLQEMYGIGVENDGELIAYYLDPQRGTNVIEQRLQLEAAGLSAASFSTLGAGFETGVAERLVDMNVQQREIAERFRGQRAITQQLVGEEEFTSSEFAAAEFGLDSEATADLARLRALREQRGVRQSGALMTRAGVVGLSNGA